MAVIMFFSERIKNINSSDKILEIGPGANPFFRSDVFLEKRFSSEQEHFRQNGYQKSAKSEKPLYYYDGGTFPFDDNQFDYIVCSHVLEHLSFEEIDKFIENLKRVSKKGYIEFPNVFYELVNFQDVHKWFMNYRDGEILFLSKDKFKSSYLHKSIREIFYGSDEYFYKSFDKFKDFYFCGFEWEDKINYRIVDNFDELVNEKDYIRIKAMLNSKKNKSVWFKDKIFSRLKNKIKNKLLSGRGFISRTAIINNRGLVKIDKGAEIQDHVIIKTYENEVKIGSYSQINPFTVIYGGAGVNIGKNVMIAPHCMIAAGNHDFRQTEIPMRFAESSDKGPIEIGDNVWIGANTTITDGVKIGRDAVVGANSVVVKDVEPFDVVCGVPAKKMYNRKEKFNND